MTVDRTIIIGDVHGCVDEFDELIKTLSYDKKFDRLILLGDLIDRGPDSCAVVQKARKMKLECVRGNHENTFLKWYAQGSAKTKVDKKAHYTQFTNEDVDYILNMPFYIKIDNTIIVHGGLKSGIPISNQSKDDLINLRYTDANREFVSLNKIAKFGKEAVGAHFWTEFWHGPESVVYGHNVHSVINPLIEKKSSNVTCYGLDTGCCFGGRLTALILETEEIVQIQAKQTYYNSKFLI